jgi:hypothetical protein
MSRATRRYRPAAIAAAAALAWASSLALTSCAAPLRLSASADPLALLEPGLAAYVRVDRELARRLASAALSGKDAASLRPILDATRCAAFGIAAAEPGARPRAEAALIGDYPFRRAAFGFAASGAWKREGRAYLHEASGLRAAVPGPNLVLASTGPLEPLLAGAKAPGPSPLPARLAGLADRELALWVPAPFSFAALGDFDLASVPLRGLLVAASPAAGGSYTATAAFLMGDADSARVYRPAIRLAWYFLCRSILGEGAGTVLSPRFELDGELVYARDLALPAEAVDRLLELAMPAALAGSGPR